MKALTDWLFGVIKESPILQGMLFGLVFAHVFVFVFWLLTWLLHFLPWPGK